MSDNQFGKFSDLNFYKNKIYGFICQTLWFYVSRYIDFGTWQQVYYAEFDGQRRKKVIVKVMGE